MRILFYQWNAFMQKDMELCLKEMGIDYHVYSSPFKGDSDKLYDEFSKEIKKGNYDAVFSFNFNSVVSICANDAGIPYLSWVVDCPLGITQDESVLRLPVNHFFVFDGYEYQRLVNMGVGNVYHHCLAVNVSRLDRLGITSRDHEKYDADVSFVGALYQSTYPGFRAKLSENESNVVESIIEKQMSVQGEYLIGEMTADESLLRSLQMTLEGEYTGYDKMFHEGLQSIIAKETTRRDRLVLLIYLSEFFDVSLYSNVDEPLLTKVKQKGLVDSFEDLFRVYKLSRINLNITYRRIQSGIPLRALEVMGAGGFLLSNHQSELAEVFDDGKDMVMYDSIEHAYELAQYYLAHDDERRKIASHGRESAGRFNYVSQFRKILDLSGLKA